MTELPQVGQKYQHKKWGEVEVKYVEKRGRGHTVYMTGEDENGVHPLLPMRLKEFQKATTCNP